jgi:hypothetical protein
MLLFTVKNKNNQELLSHEFGFLMHKAMHNKICMTKKHNITINHALLEKPNILYRQYLGYRLSYCDNILHEGLSHIAVTPL